MYKSSRRRSSAGVPRMQLSIVVSILLLLLPSLSIASQQLSPVTKRKTTTTKNSILVWMHNTNDKYQPHDQPTLIPDSTAILDTKEEKDSTISVNIFVCALAFLSASSDVISFKRHDCFVSMMTGNIMRMAYSVAELRFPDALRAFLVILSYTVGVALFQRIQDGTSRFLGATDESDNPTTTKEISVSTQKAAIVTIMSPLVLLFMGLGGLLSLDTNDSTLLRWIKINQNHKSFLGLLLMAVGGGLVNATTMHAAGGIVMFACTGHIAKIGKALGQLWQSDDIAKNRSGLALSTQIILSFMFGALVTVVAWNQCADYSSFPWFATLGGLHALLFGLYGFPAFWNVVRNRVSASLR